MINKNENINTETVEGEERNAGEAKRVEALDFHPRRTGSSPVISTKDFMKNCDWKNIGVKTDTINGRAFSRLSVLQ